MLSDSRSVQIDNQIKQVINLRRLFDIYLYSIAERLHVNIDDKMPKRMVGIPGVPMKSIHLRNTLLPTHAMYSAAHTDISCTPDICGAREKIIFKIGRVFTEKMAFQEDESFSFRAEMAETECNSDESWTLNS